MLQHGKVVCIGAGPAGLTAGYLLSKAGTDVTVLEQDPADVGGISRTASYKGFLFDIGGHRFFSKSAVIGDLWRELLPEGFIRRPRKSRIFYNGVLFDYPLRAMDALSKLGLAEALRCIASYVRAKARPHREPRHFQDWVTNKFGSRLFEIFFKTYTEKVWGMRCTEISADWAAQRIKGLSLPAAIWHALAPRRPGPPRRRVIKTLIDSFDYPRHGPGMLWQAAAAKIQKNGGQVLLGRSVTALERRHDGTWLVTAADKAGSLSRFECDHVISTMPIRHLARALSPALPAPLVELTEGLRYRDFLVVAIILKDRQTFDDNWIYIHDPSVKVGRIQNFKSWSAEMVPDETLTCYGMEYFCFEGDGIWAADDAALRSMAGEELIRLGLAEPGDIVDGTVVRQPKAYPVYDGDYTARVSAFREELALYYPNLHLVGRNGMHKYNNQDHAMMTAMLTVKNILAGRKLYDVWAVNQDAEYHEEVRATVPDPLHEDYRGVLETSPAVPVKL